MDDSTIQLILNILLYTAVDYFSDPNDSSHLQKCVRWMRETCLILNIIYFIHVKCKIVTIHIKDFEGERSLDKMSAIGIESCWGFP